MQPPNQRIVAIDYGRARLGIALSDPSGKIALPAQTIHVPKGGMAQAVEAARAGLQHLSIYRLIIGLPLELSGKEGVMAQEARAFGEDLSSKLDVEVLFYDERFSSSCAHAHLKALGLNRRQRHGQCDATAACQLLQEYLDRQPL